MAISEVDKLAGVINGITTTQEELKSNLSADDGESQEQLYLGEQISIGGTVTLTQKNYATESFILDHPVYGELDSAVYKLDGGYASPGIPYVSEAFSYPGTYTQTSIELFTESF